MNLPNLKIQHDQLEYDRKLAHHLITYIIHNKCWHPDVCIIITLYLYIHHDDIILYLYFQKIKQNYILCQIKDYIVYIFIIFYCEQWCCIFQPKNVNPKYTHIWQSRIYMYELCFLFGIHMILMDNDGLLKAYKTRKRQQLCI